MKKITYTITTLLVLWGISTYFIGNQTQKELESYIEKSNRIYSDSGLKLKLLDFNKSFFNSTAKMQIDISDPELKTLLDKEYILPIEIDYNIENGPIFFKNVIGVGISKIENSLKISSILKDDSKKEFLKIVKDDIKLKTDMSISFDKKLNYTLNSDSINIHQDNQILSMTPLKIVGTSDIENLSGEGKIEIKKLSVKDENSSNGITLNNLALDFDVREIFKESILFGDFKFSIGKLLIEDNNNPNLKEIDLSINGLMSNRKVTDNMMDSTFKANINLANTKLEKEFKDLDSVNIVADVKNMGIDGMFQFQNIAKNIQNERVALLKDMQKKSPEEMRETFVKLNKLDEKIVKEILPTLNKLLIKDKTNISYAIDINTKDKKSTKANLSIGYTGDIDFSKSMKKIVEEAQQKLLSIVSLNVDIELNKKHISLIPTPMLEEQLQMGVAQGFIKDNNSSYILKGYYKNRELIVNDNNLTSTILPLLMMFSSH